MRLNFLKRADLAVTLSRNSKPATAFTIER
jgi:hypothetical protein